MSKSREESCSSILAKYVNFQHVKALHRPTIPWHVKSDDASNTLSLLTTGEAYSERTSLLRYAAFTSPECPGIEVLSFPLIMDALLPT